MKKEKVPDSRKDFVLKERPLSDSSERRLHKFLALRGHVAKELRTYTIHGKKNTPPHLRFVKVTWRESEGQEVPCAKLFSEEAFANIIESQH